MPVFIAFQQLVHLIFLCFLGKPDIIRWCRKLRGIHRRKGGANLSTNSLDSRFIYLASRESIGLIV